MEHKLTQEQIENALDAWDAWDAVANKGRLSSVEVVKAVAPHVQYAVAKRNTPKQAPSVKITPSSKPNLNLPSLDRYLDAEEAKKAGK
jgi:hypothetical protein